MFHETERQSLNTPRNETACSSNHYFGILALVQASHNTEHIVRQTCVMLTLSVVVRDNKRPTLTPALTLTIDIVFHQIHRQRDYRMCRGPSHDARGSEIATLE